MAVYYKFKSAKDYDSIIMDGPFIAVGTLKEKIFESKHLGKGTDFDLVVTNAQTNEEYLDEAMLIPKNTSVLVRRVPGRPRMPIVTEQKPKVENVLEYTQPDKSSFPVADSSLTNYNEDMEWDEFGSDLYSIPEAVPAQMHNPLPVAPATTKTEEDNMIKTMVDNSALDWQNQVAEGFGAGRGFGRGMGGRMGGRGFGMDRKTPPPGYICYRCKIPGHFIQHCPTNGDPTFDIRRVKPPTGIPKSMLMATPDGSYSLPSGAVAVLQPNEAAFEKEVEGLPSTRSVGELPPELHCPLCKDVMKDAVLTSKCCFTSFCDKCIRDHIMSKSMCVCGATNVLADDLLPNKTLRDTINRILESGNSSAENAGSAYQVQDMESARCPPPKVPSPAASPVSKGEQNPIPGVQETSQLNGSPVEEKAVNAPEPISEKLQIVKPVDLPQDVHDSTNVKQAAAASQGGVPVADEEAQQKSAIGEPAKKKKKKKVRVTPNGMPSNDFPWKPTQDFAPENYMMPMAAPSSTFNPCWNGMQPMMDGFMGPYPGSMPFMGYGPGPLDMPFGGFMPHDPFAAQGFMFPNMPPPHRDLAEFGMGMHVPPPIRNREEFEAHKAADLRRKRENEMQRAREFSKDPRDGEYSRETNKSSSLEYPSVKSKSKLAPPTSTGDHQNHRHRSERSSPERSARDVEQQPPRRPLKRRSDHRDRSRSRDREYDYEHNERDRRHQHHHRTGKTASVTASARPTSKTTTTTAGEKVSVSSASAAEAEEMKRNKSSVFSRISFPEGEVTTKKRKISETEAKGSSASSAHHHNQRHQTKKVSSNGYYDSKAAITKSTGAGGRSDYESSDDDRHFKRKPSRYEPSPPPPPPPQQTFEDEPRRHSRGSREKDRGRDYDRYSKQR